MDARVHSDELMYPYMATSIDCQSIDRYISSTFKEYPFAVTAIPFIIIDFPISIATDTVAFPYDAYFLFEPRGQLHEAIREHSLEKVESLLKNGADSDALFEGDTPLIEACNEGDMRSICLLISYKADVNREGRMGLPLLHAYSSHSDNPEMAIQIMSILIESGANVNFIDEPRTDLGWEIEESGETVLGMLITYNAPKAVIDFLRAKGAKTAEELEAEKEKKEK